MNSSWLFLLLTLLSSVFCDAKKTVGDGETETGFYQSITVSEESPIYTTKSKYQEIEVHESEYYGKILVLDNVVQLTQRDADSYNEMMAHIPMMQHKEPKRALVIGGGDGYVLKEVLKHSSVEQVDHVDLDEEVIATCQKYFDWGDAWEDERATLTVADGAVFVQNADDESYDVIVQDSSDPWTVDDDGNKVPLPSGVLYAPKHFANIARILSPTGVFAFQAETYNIPIDLDGIAEWRQLVLQSGFKRARYGTISTSSYPTGQLGVMLCEKDPSQATSFEEVSRRFQQFQKQGFETTYYHPRLQKSCFDLPLWVEKKVYDDAERESLSDEL